MEVAQMRGKTNLGTHFILVQVLLHGIRKTTHSNSIFSKSRVWHSHRRCMSSCLDEKNVKRSVTELARTNNHFLWQQFIHLLVKESCISQENQTHWHKVSFHKRDGKQQRNLFGILQVWRSTCRHLYKTIGKGYFPVSV